MNRVWRDESGDRQDETDWFQVVVWGALAESCLGYLSKGRLVLVVGRPRMRQWEMQDGESREQLQVQAQRVIFLDRPEPKEEIDEVVEEINNRPRKCLGYNTPNEVFSENLKGLHF